MADTTEIGIVEHGSGRLKNYTSIRMQFYNMHKNH